MLSTCISSESVQGPPVHMQARDLAFKAAKAEKRAANVALLAVEGGIDHYSKSKAYDKLREISEAASVAKKV